MTPDPKLKKALDQLLLKHDAQASLEQDPLQIAHRYTEAADQEIAAIFAAQIAYGKVSLFLPVLHKLCAIWEAAKGPFHWVKTLRPDALEKLSEISYRWNKPQDFLLLGLTLQEALKRHASIGALFEHHTQEDHSDLRFCLDLSITELLHCATLAGQKINRDWKNPKDLPASFRRFLAQPSGGSACKRWHLLLRWMVRQSPPDLGLWNLSPAKLLMPIDVHVHRLSGFLGLLTRTAVDDKAVVELTQALQKLRPDDPVGYDFALSHLGISGACLGHYDPKICPKCPLYAVCIYPNQ